jgi:hypothetical protein
MQCGFRSARRPRPGLHLRFLLPSPLQVDRYPCSSLPCRRPTPATSTYVCIPFSLVGTTAIDTSRVLGNAPAQGTSPIHAFAFAFAFTLTLILILVHANTNAPGEIGCAPSLLLPLLTYLPTCCRDPVLVAPYPTAVLSSTSAFFLLPRPHYPANKATPNRPLSRNHALPARHV